VPLWATSGNVALKIPKQTNSYVTEIPMKILNTALLILIFFIILTLEAHPQGGFIKGYIIANNGDTANGEILFRNSKKASTECTFRKRQNDSTFKFSPGEISGYILIGKRAFVSKAIIKDSKSIPVFLELFVKGKASLYYYCDQDGDHYFIENEGREIVEITESPKTIQTYSGTYEVPPDYKKKLEYVFSDCEEIKPKIASSRLNSESLVRLIEEYNRIVRPTEECIVSDRESGKLKLEYRPFIGFAINKYNFGDRLITNYGHSVQIGIGFNIKNIVQSNNRYSLDIDFVLESDNIYELSKYDKTDVYGEIVWYNQKYYMINSLGTFFTVPKLKVDFGIWALRVPIKVNYSFFIKRITLSLSGGITERIILKQNKNLDYEWFSKQYGATFNDVFVGPTGGIKIDYNLKNKHAFFGEFYIEYLVDPFALQQFLRLQMTQSAIRFGYRF
jgi:hypothetical protein